MVEVVVIGDVSGIAVGREACHVRAMDVEDQRLPAGLHTFGVDLHESIQAIMPL